MRAGSGVQQIDDRQRLVHAHQRLALARRRAEHERQMNRAQREVAVGDEVEAPPGGLDVALERAAHQRLVAAAVLDEIGDGAGLERVLGGELQEIGHPRHGAVLAHDLAKHRGRRQAGKPREIAARFGVPGAHQHAAALRDEREHMPRLHDVLGTRLRGRRDLDGQSAIVRRDAGGDALGRFDGDGEVGAVARAVLLDHRTQAEARGVLLGDRHADQAAPVAGEEVDLVGRDELGGEYEVALVLAVLVVDQDHDPAGADLRDDLADRADGSGVPAHGPILCPF